MADTNGTAPDWDVFPKMAPYFDKHLLFPLLNNLNDSPEKDKAIFTLLKDSAMVDFLGELDAKIKGADAPTPEYTQKRQAAIDKRESLAQQSEKMLNLLDDEEVINNLRGDKEANFNYLKTTYEVTPEDVAVLYDYGRYLYESGVYDEASNVLQRFRLLVGHLSELLLEAHRI
jgi:translation initiation factor 3 subunit E